MLNCLQGAGAAVDQSRIADRYQDCVNVVEPSRDLQTDGSGTLA